jgi:hypothetical protein
VIVGKICFGLEKHIGESNGFTLPGASQVNESRMGNEPSFKPSSPLTEFIPQCNCFVLNAEQHPARRGQRAFQ